MQVLVDVEHDCLGQARASLQNLPSDASADMLVAACPCVFNAASGLGMATALGSNVGVDAKLPTWESGEMT